MKTMNKILNLGFAALLLAGMTACSGSSNDEPDTPKPSDIQAPYTLSVDKQEIEADGKDVVTFTVTDANGNVLTDAAHIGDVTIRNAETGASLGRKVNTFTSLTNWTYKFSASYQGKLCENQVTVTAKNRKAYETYFRNTVCYKLTSVTCVNCPSMTAALNATPEEWKEHMIVLAIHGNLGSNPDPWTLQSNGQPVVNMLASTFCNGYLGYPTAIFNMNKVLEERSGSAISALIQEQMRDYPATCGIKVATRYEESKILVDASLTSSAGGDYELVYALIRDNCKYTGSGTYPDREGGYYDHVCLAISPNYARFSEKNAFHVEKGAEHSAATYEIQLGGEVSREILNDCHVVVFATRSVGNNAAVVDNATLCAIDATADYKENE